MRLCSGGNGPAELKMGQRGLSGRAQVYFNWMNLLAGVDPIIALMISKKKIILKTFGGPQGNCVTEFHRTHQCAKENSPGRICGKKGINIG